MTHPAPLREPDDRHAPENALLDLVEQGVASMIALGLEAPLRARLDRLLPAPAPIAMPAPVPVLDPVDALRTGAGYRLAMTAILGALDASGARLRVDSRAYGQIAAARDWVRAELVRVSGG